jgi:hypothetical protein
MGDLKKIISKPLKYGLPILGAAFGAGFLGVGAGSWSWGTVGLSGFNAVQGFMIGSALAGMGSKKKVAGDSGQQAYGFGRPANTLSATRAVPIVYGKVKVTNGNIIWARTHSDGQTRDQAVALAQGEVESVTDIRLNNRPITDFDGCSADAYTGTAAQTPDAARMDGHYKGSVKNLAYVAATIKAGEQLSGDAAVTAIVKGRKIAVYDGAFWTTEWSNNAAWVIRDFLVEICGIPEAAINDDSFYAVAQLAEATVTGQYDRGDNVATAGTITGGTNPTLGNDGSLAASGSAWSVHAAQDENLVYLGKLDLGSSKYTDLIKLHLWDPDDRYFYNYKITVSTDDSTYDTVFDGTGSGNDYAGTQIVEFTARNVRYVKVYISGNSVNSEGDVKELEVFELVPAVRATLNGIISDERQARDIVSDMLASCGCMLVYSGGQFHLRMERDEASVFSFDASNILDGTLSYRQVPRIERPNRTIAHWVNPHRDWMADSAVDNDTAGQAADGVIKREISLPWCTSRSQAGRLARQAGNTARETEWTAVYEGAYDGLELEAGDMVDLTDADMGWTSKKFRIQELSELPDGRRRITAQEHISSIYADQAGIQFDASEVSSLPDPEALPAHCTGLTLSETNAAPGDGAWIPQITVDFTPPTRASQFWSHAIIQVSTDGGSTYKDRGISTDGTFLITELQAGSTYHVRVISVSVTGRRAPAGTAPYGSITLAGKSAAPSNVSGFNYSIARGVFELAWNTATDANNDLSHYEIRDGASWAAGTVLATDLRTTRYPFAPTKRTYQLWIKAFDRSGNESAAATELNVSKAAPTITGVPDVIQIPAVKLRVQFACTNDPSIIRYDIHASLTSGFSPDATTLVTQAAPSISGLGVGEFTGTVGNTYYVKVCPIDFISDVVGDKYTYPSSQGSGVVRKIEGDDITANTILTNHLSTSGIDVGGSGSKPIYVRVMNAASTVIGYIGQFTWNAVTRYGGRFLDLIVGDEADPALVVLADGTARLKRSMNIGGDTDRVLSNAESPGNMVPNGGFEQVHATGALGATTTLLPCWTYSYAGTWSGNSIYIYDRMALGESSAQNRHHTGRFSIGLYASTAQRSFANTPKIRIQPGVKYQVSWSRGASNASPGQPYYAKVLTYNYDGTSNVRALTAESATLTNTSLERASYSYTAGATEMFAEIWFEARLTASSANYLILDSVKHEPGNEVTAYTEAPLSSTDSPIGLALNTNTGFQVFASSAERCRIGNIGGMSAGTGLGTVAANTMGFWLKGGFYLLNASGDAMITASGSTENAFVSDTIAGAVFKSATRESLDGIIASGTIAKRDSWPYTLEVAYATSVVPYLNYRWRPYDSGTSAYGHYVNGASRVTEAFAPGGGAYACHSTVMSAYAYYDSGTAKVKVVFQPVLEWINVSGGATSVVKEIFSSGNKTYFWLYTTGWVLDDIWDTIEVDYEILAKGKLS